MMEMSIPDAIEEEKEIAEVVKEKEYGIIDMTYNPIPTIKMIKEKGLGSVTLPLLDKFSVRVGIMEEDFDMWRAATYWLYKRNPEVFLQKFLLQNYKVSDYFNKHKKLPETIPYEMAGALVFAKEEQCVKLDNTNLLFVVAKKLGDRRMKDMEFLFIGLNARDYSEKFLNFLYVDSKKLATSGKWQYVVTSDANQYDIPFKSFDYVTMKDNDRKELLDLLERWSGLKSVYEDMGVTHKCGILLYGPPGTGKTSLIRAIAGHLKLSILFLNAKSYDRWERLISEVGEDSIIVFEDIDYILDKKENSKNSKDRTESLDRLGTALQVLDGIFSPSHSIFIATTNHIEELDENLIRDGRFDLKIEMPEFDLELATRMCKTCDVPADDVLKGVEYPLKPARLQNMILKYKASHFKGSTTDGGDL